MSFDDIIRQQAAQRFAEDESIIKAQLAVLGIPEDEAPSRVVIVYDQPLVGCPRSPRVMTIHEFDQRFSPDYGPLTLEDTCRCNPKWAAAWIRGRLEAECAVGNMRDR